MNRLLLLFLTSLLAVGFVGCSDDDAEGPTGPNNPITFNDTTVWVASGQFFRTTVDASSSADFSYFSFTEAMNDTASGSAALSAAAEGWDLAFRREVIKTNGGASGDAGGDVEATDLGAVTFADVTLDDTAGVSWVSDNIDYFFGNWYTYTGPPLHQLFSNRYVYSMLDASGHHYVKFRIDSLTSNGFPPDMGTVWLTYYYQPTADSRNLPGPTVSTSFAVESGTVYFDFSAGTVVTPASPSTSLDWDLGFHAYDVFQNSGPNGAGDAQGFYAFTELTDSTDIDAFTAQPTGAPLFADIPSSALTDWYNYTGAPLHQLLSKENVYLIRTGGVYYKLMIESYYANINGVPTSAHYTFIWNEL